MIISIFISLVGLLYCTYLIIIRRASIFHLIYPIFFIFFSLPVILNTIYGLPDYFPFIKVIDSYNDELSLNIYYIFIVSFTIFGFYFFRKNKVLFSNIQVNSRNNPASSKHKISSFILRFAFFLPLIYFLFSSKYWPLILLPFGYSTTTDTFLKFPEFLIQVSFLSYILLYSNNKKENSLLVIIMLFYIFINGKRYLIAEFFYMTMVLSIINFKLKPFKIFIIGGILTTFILFFSIYYQFYLKDGVEISNLFNQVYKYIRIDFSRDYTLIYSIFASFNNIEIMDFRGQALLYNLLIFIPRSLISFKPWPFSQYISLSMMGFPTSFLPLNWGTTTSIFSEWTADFGIFGLIFSSFFYFALISIVERSKNPLIIKLMLFILIRLITVEFVSIAISFYIVLFCLLIFNSKIDYFFSRRLGFFDKLWK